MLKVVIKFRIGINLFQMYFLCRKRVSKNTEVSCEKNIGMHILCNIFLSLSGHKTQTFTENKSFMYFHLSLF